MYLYVCGAVLPISLHPPPPPDPLEESEEWMEEDLAALTIHGHSKKPQSPVYTRKMIDPLGLSWDEGRGGKRKPSNDNLGEMFPHGEGSGLGIGKRCWSEVCSGEGCGAGIRVLLR